MPSVTIGFGVALIVLGVCGYFASGMVSLTALIPAVFGALLAVLGAMARDEKKLKTAMHIAVLVGVIGVAGSVRGLLRLPALMSGAEVERPEAVVAQAIMAVLMLVFVGLCVKSFIDARRQRAKAQGA